MKRKQAFKAWSGHTAGHRPGVGSAFEFANPGLQLLFDQRHPQKPVRLALKAFEREVIERPFAGIARFDQSIKEDARDGAIPRSLAREGLLEPGGGGGGFFSGDLEGQVPSANVSFEVVAKGLETREGGVGLGLERLLMLECAEAGLP